MAKIHERYGKDMPSNREERYIDEALVGGRGPSNGLHKYPVDRRDQYILTPVALDNLDLCYDEPTSILDTEFAGGVENIEHSLTGASAVSEEIGAAGKVKHVIIPNH